MRYQAGQNVMAVLPNGFHDHNRSVRGNFTEDLHAALLRINEAVLFCGVDSMAALNSKSEMFRRFSDSFFNALLSHPTGLVGRQAQIAARDQNHGLRHASYSID